MVNSSDGCTHLVTEEAYEQGLRDHAGQIRRHGPGPIEQMRELLASPMVLTEPLEESNAAQAGELVQGRDLNPDVAAAQVATCARARNWPVLVAQPAGLRLIDPELTVETLPGMP